MQTEDFFGYSVSISGNYAIVGSFYEDGGDSDPALTAGAAYIFERASGGGWTQRVILHASDMQANDNFGISVSISGDYAIVGAPGEDGGIGDLVSGAGAAYIFERDSGGTWNQQTILHASDLQANDSFGYSVAISGNHAIVGAFTENGGAGDHFSHAGAAYIFERDSGGTWNQQAILHASDLQVNDYFGFSAAISGDYAIVGARLEDGGAGDLVTDAGAAYIFEKDSGGTWNQQQILHASDMQSTDWFGYSVAISGSYAVVGAQYEDGGNGDPFQCASAAYIFERDSGGTWNQQQILHASDMQAFDYFGTAVSISGNRAIVGACSKEGVSGGPVSRAGAAYVFERDSGGAWMERTILQASDMQADDFFGDSVCISENYIIVGADFEDGGDSGTVSNTGAAYIFE